MITAVLVKERDAASGPSLAMPGIEILPRAIKPPTQTVVAPVKMQIEAQQTGASVTATAEPQQPAAAAPASDAPNKLSDEGIAALVAGGRQLIAADDIPNARLVLQQAAEARNAAAALELGATYDPFILQQLKAGRQAASVEWARRWYEEAKGLGSTEAAVRLDRLRSVPIELWR